jgi:ankyrin repeat protein
MSKIESLHKLSHQGLQRMIGFLKVDINEKLKKELFKDYINESKIKKLIDGGADIDQVDSKGRTLLFELAKKRKLESMRILITSGSDIHTKDAFGKTLLSEAVSRGDTVVIRFLLDNGVDINAIGSGGRTISHDIAQEGNHKVFRVLIPHNPDFSIQDDVGRTVLFDAVKGKNPDIVRDIVNNISPEVLNVVDENGETALFEAVLLKDCEIAKLLISNGVDVNTNNESRQNVMFNTIIQGAHNDELIKILLKKGIKLNQKDADGKTILDELLKIATIAEDPYVKVEGKYRLVDTSNDYLKLTSSLIDSGLAIDRKDKDGKSALFREVINKNFDNIEFLLASGADINEQDNEGKTPLFEAVMGGISNIAMIDYLVNKGADIDYKDIEENTIVDDLVELILVQSKKKQPRSKRFFEIDQDEDYLGLLKKMLGHKPKINAPKRNGRTVLFEVVNYSHLDLIRVLLNSGADANLSDNEENTPLSLLIDNGMAITKPKEREEFLERLVFMLKFRVDVNSTDKDGRTVFHKAVLADDIDVVEKLLTKRANLNIKDKQGRTALHQTQWKGNYKIARLLIAAGADINAADYSGFTVINYAAILGHSNLVITLISAGVLMYNHNRKSKAVAEFFKSKLENLPKLLSGDITDPKMRDAISQVINNLTKEVNEALAS